VASLVRNFVKWSCTAGAVFFSASAFASGGNLLPNEFFGFIAIIGVAVGSFSVAFNAKASHLLFLLSFLSLSFPCWSAAMQEGQ
jgi:hypothetical protein